MKVEPNITSKIIRKSVLSILEKLNFSLEKCVKIKRDNKYTFILSEKCRPVKILKVKIENAINCSCFNRIKNLSIMKGCKIKCIRNDFGLGTEV